MGPSVRFVEVGVALIARQEADGVVVESRRAPLRPRSSTPPSTMLEVVADQIPWEGPLVLLGRIGLALAALDLRGTVKARALVRVTAFRRARTAPIFSHPRIVCYGWYFSRLVA